MTLPIGGRLRRRAAVVGLALLQVACGRWSPPAEPLPSTEGHLLVAFRRTGGIAGLNQLLTVDKEGEAVVEDRRFPPTRLKLPPERLQALEAALQTADFPSLRPWYPADSGARDVFYFDVSYRGKQVRADQTGRIPERLHPVLKILTEIVNEATTGRP